MRADAILNGKVLAVEENHLRKLMEAGELFGTPPKPEDFPRSQLDFAGDVAVVYIRGMVSHGLSEGEQWWLDAFDTDEVAARLSAVMSHPGVRAVVLAVNSPGGMVVGTPELAALVREANGQKPVVAHTSSLMASAAYWMASGAEKIFATASAEVGSVGCYAVHLDLSAAQTMTGVRPVVFRSGSQKAAGVLGTKLTPEQAQDIAAGVEAVGREFRKAVKDARPGVAEDALDGRCFSGAAAEGLGLVDGICDLAGAVRAARQLAEQRERETMELNEEISRLKGELEAANGLLAEAEKTAKESAAIEEGLRKELADAKADAEAARAELATKTEELAKAQDDLAEAKNLLAAQPSALHTAGTKPVAGVFDGSNPNAATDWKAALAECGGDYVAARRKYPEAWKASMPQ